MTRFEVKSDPVRLSVNTEAHRMRVFPVADIRFTVAIGTHKCVSDAAVLGTAKLGTLVLGKE